MGIYEFLVKSDTYYFSVMTEPHLEREMQVTVTRTPTTPERVTIMAVEHPMGRTCT